MRILKQTKAHILIFLFLFIISAASWAESEDSFVLLPLAVEFPDSESIDPGEQKLLTTLLLNEIAGTDGKIVVRDVSGLFTEKPYNSSTLPRELLESGLAGWLYVSFDKRDDLIGFSAEYRFFEGGKVVFSLENWDYTQSAFRNPTRLFLVLKEAVRDVNQRRRGNQYLAPVIVKGPAGSIVKGFSSEDLYLDSQGAVVLDLAAPAVYSYTLYSPGHYPQKGSVLIDVAGAEIEIEAENRKPLFLDFYMADFNVPGLELGVRFGKNRGLFVKGGGYSYLFTLIPMLNDPEERYGFILSEPLSVMNIHIGFMISPWERPYRLYLSAGLFARLVHSARYFGIDPIGPWGTSVSAGLEITAGKRLRLYCEYYPLLYFTKNLEYLENLFSWGAVSFPSSAESGALLSYLNGRLGIRIEL